MKTVGLALQTAVLQNLLGYLSLDSLRRALLIKVRLSHVSGDVSAGKNADVSGCLRGGELGCFSESLLLLFMRVKEALQHRLVQNK